MVMEGLWRNRAARRGVASRGVTASLALLIFSLAKCTALDCPEGQVLGEASCVCISTLEPAVDGACIDDGCDPTGCPCTLEGIEAAIARGGMQVIKCESGAPPVVTRSSIFVDNDVILDGQGNLIVQGDGTDAIFYVQPYEVELVGMTVSLGDQGIRNEAGATLTVRDSVVKRNTAIFSEGGGIHNAGILTLVESEVTENQTPSIKGGGGIYNAATGTATVTSSKISDNISTIGAGAGIINVEGSLTVSGSELSNNDALDHGGGGLANVAGTITVTDCLVRDNFASGLGGGIVNFHGTANVINTTIEHNTSNQQGGGLSTAACVPDCFAATQIIDSVISNNQALGKVGGGVYCENSVLMSTRTTVSENHTTHDGGGFMLQGARTSASIVGNTVSSNSADGVGGGIRLYDNATLTLVNSTVHDNFSPVDGALHLDRGGSADIESSTFSKNDAVSRQGIPLVERSSAAIVHLGSGTLTFVQSIIDDTCMNVANTVSRDDNIESPYNTCQLDAANDAVNVTPEALGVADQLADNGGRTMTLMLSAESLAVDYVSSACDQSQDQRGVARPQGQQCDTGAVEVADPP
jgi:fibronectin-binding autotransporter adhesin